MGGRCSRISRGTPEARSRLCVCRASFLMTFAMGRAPAPGSDRIPVELFQILKDDAVESAALNMQYAICTQYAICRLLAVHQQMNRRAKWGTMYKEYVFCSLVVAKSCPTLCDPMTVGYACQAPLWNSPGKNTGVGCRTHNPGDLPNPGIKPMSPASLELAGGFFTSELTGKPEIISNNIKCLL